MRSSFFSLSSIWRTLPTVASRESAICVMDAVGLCRRYSSTSFCVVFASSARPSAPFCVVALLDCAPESSPCVSTRPSVTAPPERDAFALTNASELLVYRERNHRVVIRLVVRLEVEWRIPRVPHRNLRAPDSRARVRLLPRDASRHTCMSRGVTTSSWTPSDPHVAHAHHFPRTKARSSMG